MTGHDGATAVLIEVRGPVTIITINRPGSRNAVNRDVAAGLDAALTHLEDDRTSRVGVLTGRGGHFCAGMDLRDYLTEGVPTTSGGGFAGITQRWVSKPLVAAVEGYALAGGFEIALACDLIVAARGARFGLPEVKVGLVAAAGGLVRLPRRLPYHLAMALALTGRTLDAEQAHRHGLVAELCDDGTATEQAIALAQQIAQHAPLAVRASKRVVAESQSWPPHEAFALQRSITDPVFASADAREGPLAFTQHRPANWRDE